MTTTSKTEKTNAGFTLVELLVVIAVIGVLATIIVSSLGNARVQANDAKIKSQASAMRTQAYLWVPTGFPAATPTGGLISSIISARSNPIGGPITPFGDTAASGSFMNIMVEFPVGTIFYYYFDGNVPMYGGKWMFAANLGGNSGKNGAFCVDWSGATKTVTAVTTTLVDFQNDFPGYSNYLCS